MSASRSTSLAPQRGTQVSFSSQCDRESYRVAYTFDAGPNAVIYTLQEHVPEFVQVVRHFFPSEANGSEFVRGLPVCSADLSEELKRDLNMEPTQKGIHYIISTKAGPGPCVVEDPNLHLLGVDGLPKKSAVSD